MDARRAGYLVPARILALLAGIATFVLLVAQGVPSGEDAVPGKRVTLTHTARSGCPTKCEKPERGKTKVTVSRIPATPASDPGLIEKAVDNDAGVLVIRFIVAVLTALTTAATVDRLLRGPGKPGPPEQNRPVEPPQKPQPPSGPEEPEPDDPNAGKSVTEKNLERVRAHARSIRLGS